MTRPAQSSLILSVLGVAWLLHATVRVDSFSYIPAPLFLSVVLTWLVPGPLYYFAALIVASELFSTLPPGTMTLALMLPWILWRWRGKITIDISFSFLAWLTLSVLAPVVVIRASGLVALLITTPGMFTLGRYVPWLQLLFTTVGTAAAAFVTLNLIAHMTTRGQRPMLYGHRA